MSSAARAHPTLALRKACAADAIDILAWRNDPVTRAMSRNTGVIGCDDHLQWFAAALQDPARLLLIAMAGEAKVGMARFDELAPRVWEVSINLNPACRGQGLSHAVLSGALQAITERHAERIMAEIKPTNAVSRHLFEAHGFRKVAHGREMDTFEL
jgi:L-amino acid N-acyltransferase YncA